MFWLLPCFIWFRILARVLTPNSQEVSSSNQASAFGGGAVAVTALEDNEHLALRW